jgi:uncharacterized protein with PQ loop repeat
MFDVYGICGIIAACLIAIFSIPQLVHCIYKKDISDVNLILYFTCLFWQGCFLAAGVCALIDNNLSVALPQLISQSVGISVTLTLIIWKIISNCLLAKTSNNKQVAIAKGAKK